MKVAIVGCGLIADIHARCVGLVEEDRLVSVADVNPSAARAFGDKFGAQAFGSVEALLAETAPEAAIVCTPPNSHRQIAGLLLESGVPVLCEKPLAHSLSDAEALVDIASRTGLPAYVAYCHRFNPATQLMREYVQQGRLGVVHTFRNAFIESSPGIVDTWHTDPQVAGGGCLIGHGSHSIDILQFITGPVVDVRAQLHFAEEGRGDVAADLITLGENGVAGLISVSHVSARDESRFEVIGTEMAMEYDYVTSGRTVTIYRPSADPVKEDLPESCDVRFLEQYRAFREALHGRPTLLATFEDGLSVSRVVDRCQRQAGIQEIV